MYGFYDYDRRLNFPLKMSTLFSMISIIQCYIRLINDRSAPDHSSPLQIRRNVASLSVLASFMIWFHLYWHARVSPEDWMMLNGSVFLQYYVEHMDTNSLFLEINFWNSLQNHFFAENYNGDLFKKRCYT